jgi:hypothetical protein
MTATLTKPAATKRPQPQKKLETVIPPPADLPTAPPMMADPDGRTWRLTWGADSWTEDDLYGAHAAIITILSGKDSWDLLDPMQGPSTTMFILAAFIATTERRDPLEIMGELGRSTAKQLLGAISFDS